LDSYRALQRRHAHHFTDDERMEDASWLKFTMLLKCLRIMFSKSLWYFAMNFRNSI
jgi:hypothetical protein